MRHKEPVLRRRSISACMKYYKDKKTTHLLCWSETHANHDWWTEANQKAIFYVCIGLSKKLLQDISLHEWSRCRISDDRIDK